MFQRYLGMLAISLFCFVINGPVCVKIIHSGVSDRTYIFLILLIIIKSEVSTFPNAVIFSVAVCLRWLYTIFSQLFHTYPGKVFFLPIIIVQSMMCVNNGVHYGLKVVLLCLHISLSLFYRLIRRHTEHIKCLVAIFCLSCLT